MATPAKTGQKAPVSGKAPAKTAATSAKTASKPALPAKTASKPAATPSVPISPNERAVLACQKLTPLLTGLFEEFWGVPIEMRFFGTLSSEAYFLRTEDSFVSEMPITEDDNLPGVRLKLSEAAISSLLTHALGPRNNPAGFFQLADLTGFEGQLMTEFSKSLFGELAKALVNRKVDPKVLKKEPALTHLVWVLRSRPPKTPARPAADKPAPEVPLQFAESTEGGKLVLSVPTAALKLPPETRLAIRPVRDTFFMEATSPARIGVGFARVPLADIKALEDGDIVVLTDSQSGQMLLLDDHSEGRLPFSADMGGAEQRISLPMTQDIVDMENELMNTQQNLWDNLTIEVGAEFEPIKLPLKQLRQMSEGLVVEVGDLVHNRVHLKVEGKTLAHGELVIVGDKFGVRISKVDADRESAGTAMTPAAKAAPAKPAAKPTPKAERAPESQGMDASDMAPPEPETPPAGNDDDFLDDDFDDDDDW